MSRRGQAEIWNSRFRKYVMLIAVLWVAVIGSSLAWNLELKRWETQEVARAEVYVASEMDMLYRRWTTLHGGVYVPVTPQTPPNRYLDVPERDIQTPSGQALTLMNPEYVMREIHEMRSRESGVYGHFISLKPFRPENLLDSWEADALKRIEQRMVSEVSSIAMIRGKPYMRLMRPLPVEEGCLKCHANQGYKVGDLRGGISTAVPMEPLRMIARSHMVSLVAWHGIILLLGLGGIGGGAWHLKRRIAERRRAEEALQESERRYRTLFDSIPLGLYRTTPKGQIIDVNPALSQMLGYPDRESLQANASTETYVNPEDRIQWQTLVEREKVLKNYQKQLRRRDGSIIWVEENTHVVRQADGTALYYEGSFHDITERKQGEEERERLIRELQKALGEVKTLRGFLPICASCKKIRDDKGYWNQIEVYVRDHTEAEFSHGICPDCLKKLYPELEKKDSKKGSGP